MSPPSKRSLASTPSDVLETLITLDCSSGMSFYSFCSLKISNFMCIKFEVWQKNWNPMIPDLIRDLIGEVINLKFLKRTKLKSKGA